MKAYKTSISAFLAAALTSTAAVAQLGGGVKHAEYEEDQTAFSGKQVECLDTAVKDVWGKDSRYLTSFISNKNIEEIKKRYPSNVEMSSAATQNKSRIAFAVASTERAVEKKEKTFGTGADVKIVKSIPYNNYERKGEATLVFRPAFNGLNGNLDLYDLDPSQEGFRKESLGVPYGIVTRLGQNSVMNPVSGVTIPEQQYKAFIEKIVKCTDMTP